MTVNTPALRTRRVAACALFAALAFAPSSAHAFTVVEEKSERGAVHYEEISCGQSLTESWGLPRGATNVRVSEPKPGDPILDGFGRDVVARVEAVAVSPGARPSVDVTATGSDVACQPIVVGSEEIPRGPVRTSGIDVRARYDVVTHPKLFLSDQFGGADAKQRPKRLTADADAGWRKLQWSDWGERKATARGRFYGVRVIVQGPRDVDLRTFTYPVKVTVSKVRLCNGRYHYPKLRTAFTSGAPKEIRKQAKPPAYADCLRG